MINILKNITITFIFLVGVCSLSQAQTLDNVEIEEQEDGTIAIYYDIYGGLDFDVSVFCSTDLENPLKLVRGDVGKGVIGGTRKKVIWRMIDEVGELPFDVYFEVRAKFKTIELEMILVTGGNFMMGSSRGSLDEVPAHQVTLDNFYLSAKEVTVGEYKQFVKATGRQMPARTPQGGWNDDFPMVYVTWYDAQAFCEWAGGTLPTEAEWEFAAKGGMLSNNYVYAGSNRSTQVGWHDINSGYKLHSVGTKNPNELGFYDMSGNASEWCFDWYSKTYYKRAEAKNPQGAKKSKRKALRGGSFIDFAFLNRTAKRTSLPPAIRAKDVGFRLKKSVEE